MGQQAGARQDSSRIVGFADRRREQFGESKIEDLGESLGGHDDVGWFQVPVNDSLAVRFRQRVRQLYGDAQHLGNGHAGFRNQLVQRRSGHVLHGDEVGSILMADFVDGNDVRMIQGRRGARFLHEPRPALGVVHFLRWQNLDGNGPAQLEVARLVHDSHASLAELFGEAIMADI